MATKFDLERRIATLETRLEKQERVQTAALRRIHLLPDNIRNLVGAESIGTAVLAPGGQGMTYSIGGNLELTIYPYAESFELIDSTGVNGPLTVDFGEVADFDRAKVLTVIGYAELAKRGGDGQTVTDWVSKLNGSAALATA